MGLNKLRPPASSRMGILWTLVTMQDVALLEFGSMGHMVYADALLERVGIEREAKLFTTHIDETDISLGRLSRLETAIAELCAANQYKAIFLLPSALPEMIGVDLQAVCDEFGPNYPDVVLLPFSHGGFQYGAHQGVEAALLRLVKTFAGQSAPEERSAALRYNILGSCADLYRFRADEAELKRMVQGAFGAETLVSLSAQASPEAMRNMGESSVNLVMRREAIAAAQYLQDRFGTPWIFSRPYGLQASLRWLRDLGVILQQEADLSFIREEEALGRRTLDIVRQRLGYAAAHIPVLIGGHADIAEGIAAFAEHEAGLKVAARWCDNRAYASKALPWLDEDSLLALSGQYPDSIAMTSGELLELLQPRAGHQISWPGKQWEVNPFEPPLLGFRGALHLLTLWVNSV